MPFAPFVASLLLVVGPGAPSSFLLLVAMPGAPNSVLVPSSVLVPNNDGLQPTCDGLPRNSVLVPSLRAVHTFHATLTVLLRSYSLSAHLRIWLCFNNTGKIQWVQVASLQVTDCVQILMDWFGVAHQAGDHGISQRNSKD